MLACRRYLSDVRFLVFDEADVLLDDEFGPALLPVLRRVPPPPPPRSTTPNELVSEVYLQSLGFTVYISEW